MDRVYEMIAQMGNMFQKEGRQVETNVVEKDEMLMELAHVADVRNDWNAELLTHDAHG